MRLLHDFSRLFAFLLRHSRGIRYSRPLVVAVIITSALSGLSGTAVVSLVNVALSDGLSAGRGLLWSFAGLCLVIPLCRFVSMYCLTYLTQKSVYTLRVSLSRMLLAAPLRHLEEVGTPRILASLTGDIPTITNALAMSPVLCMHFSIIVSALFYLGWLSWPTLAVVLGLFAAGIVTYQLPLVRAVKYLERVREEQNSLLSHFRSMTEGTKELKLHHPRREAFFSQLLEPTARRLRQDGLRGNVLYAGSVSWGQIIFFLIIGLLLFAVPALVSTEPRVLTGYVLILLYLMIPLEVILGSIPIFSQAAVAVRKVEELGAALRSEGAELPPPAQPPANSSLGTLELRGVTHSYYREQESRRFTLGPVDLKLRGGEILFIIGGNGSGKTTFAKLLTGLYTPEGGEMLIDGRAVTDENREEYRQNFSAVFSDFYLFESLLGLSAEGLDAETGKYLAQLQLGHKVQVRGGVLSTTELSQGQRKRLALLAAYLEDRPVYVFDEWAADQDPVFKEIFYLQLLPELKARGKTVVVITHDDRYFDAADRIVKMEEGRILTPQLQKSAEQNLV